MRDRKFYSVFKRFYFV